MVTEYVINEVPAVIPVISPVPGFTVATNGLELVQVPPADVLVQVSVEPSQIGVTPAIVWATGAVIVTDCVAMLVHPPMATVYVI